MLHRHARPAVAGAYAAGAIAGACTTVGALLVVSGFISPVPVAARTVVSLCLMAILALHAIGVVCLDLPERRHQIPRETFTTAPVQAAFQFAFELGMGVRTYITAVSPYALAVLVVLRMPATFASAIAAAATAAVGYGLGRSIVVVSQSMRSSIAVDHPKRWLRAADLITIMIAFAAAIVV